MGVSQRTCTRAVVLRRNNSTKLKSLILALACLVGCFRRDPQKVFDHAQQTLVQGDISAAAKEAEQGYRDFHNVSTNWAWMFAILRARVLHWQGRDDEVLALFSSEPGPPSSGELVLKKKRLEAAAYISLHKFTEAEHRLADAERICAVRGYASCADVASSRGILKMERGDYASAQVIFERVLAAARSSSDKFLEANTLLDLSWSADEQTHFDEALNWATSAREVAIPFGFADVSQTALGNMGWAYYKLGDPEKAKEMFSEAGAQAADLGNPTDQIRWLTNTGYIYMDASEFKVAGQSFQRSLDLAHTVNSRDDILNALIALSFVSEQTNKLDDAKRYADEALAMARADGNKRDETYPRLVQGRVAAQQNDPAAAEAAYHEVETSPDAPVFLKWEAERSLARLYEGENQTDAARREYRTALSTFEAARSQLQHENSRLPFLTNASHIYDDYIHLLVSQGKTDEALRVAEYSRARTLSEGLGFLKPTTSFQPDPLNASQIARKVGGSIFFYWLGAKQSYLWLVTAQKTTLFALPPGPEIEAMVQRYRKALVGPLDPLETSNDDGIALYRALVAPAKALLPKDAKIFIIPDGGLNTLNFETLLVPDPSPHYWIEDATIADASSLRLLAASRAANKHPSGLLLMGNAVAPNLDYPELRKAASEMDSIEKHFPAAQRHAFDGAQATPSAYLASKPEQFSYIHFVAHGTASRMSPLDSAIVLSRSNAQDDSFKLYARDIIHQPLRAELVTISTCYGAGSRAYSGEGLVGLSWAFLRAGAHNVIGALWEVSDVSTPQLMDDVYSGLNKGESPEVALRSAKLSLLHSGGAFRKPFYWAPFQIYTGS
jgi:CHAT domain-containing protein